MSQDFDIAGDEDRCRYCGMPVRHCDCAKPEQRLFVCMNDHEHESEAEAIICELNGPHTHPPAKRTVGR